MLQERQALADLGGTVYAGIVQKQTEYATHWKKWRTLSTFMVREVSDSLSTKQVQV